MSLYEEYMKAASGHVVLEIKEAALNVLFNVIVKHSSNMDEAAYQWNKLSDAFEQQLLKLYGGRSVITPDEAMRLFTKVNGDR
jgi:hypothetical protein